MQPFAALFTIACAPFVAGCAAIAAGSGVSRMADLAIYVQVCVPDRSAFVEETLVDASSVPRNVSEQDWKDMLLKATAVGRRETLDEMPRAVVPVRDARPGPGPDGAERSLAFGSVEVRGPTYSRGGGGINLSDATQRNQPVYGRYTGFSPGELKAVNVTIHRDQGGQRSQVRYWFAPPRQLPRDAYTSWLPPTYQDAGVFSRPDPSPFLWAGKPLPSGDVDAHAPRVRFTVLRAMEYHQEGGALLRAVRAQQLGHATNENRVLWGPQVVERPIPGC